MLSIEEALGEEGMARCLSDLERLWINPELEVRRSRGSLPKGFRIRECLIKLPPGEAPVVQFNDEIVWSVSASLPPDSAFKVGEPVHVYDLCSFVAIDKPRHDGHPVPFFFVFSTGNTLRVIFDASVKPTSESSFPSDSAIGSAILQCRNLVLREKVAGYCAVKRTLLNQIGLWAVPALTPYPLAYITRLLEKGEPEDARAALLSHCGPAFLREVVLRWNGVEAFRIRAELFEEALAAHIQGQFRLSIHALIPQVEGVVSDWLSVLLPSVPIPWRQESKTKLFKDLVLKEGDKTFLRLQFVESVIDFILSGPVLATFRQWTQQVSGEFPNRHVIEHGKYVDSLFNEENSLKLFLLLDSLFQVLAWEQGL